MVSRNRGLRLAISCPNMRVIGPNFVPDMGPGVVLATALMENSQSGLRFCPLTLGVGWNYS